MKINFRKISAIAASALMTGMTMGVAAAANYPAPFVSGGVANVAVVYGTGTGVSSLDLVQANNIQDSLGESVSGGSVIVEGGESFVLEKTSTKFHLGDSLTGLYTTLDDGELVEFLADGVYDSGSVDEDYEQEITLASVNLELFSSRDYNNEEPTFGFVYDNADLIAEYTITFDNEIPWADIAETDLPIMGKEFYVISAEQGEIVMLDSAEKTVLAEGDSVTVGDKTVEIEYLENDAVKFNVDGEITDTLAGHEYFELDDGSFIVANDIMFASKESGISKVEFSIGAGQVVLTDGAEIEVNEDAVDGLEVTFTDTVTGLTALTLSWYSDDDSFLTEENALTMPEPFDSIRLVFNGLDFPSSAETVALEAGETLTLAMDNYDLPLMWWDGAAAHLGEEYYELILAVGANTQAYTGVLVGDLTTGIEVQEDNRFLVTSFNTDLTDIEVAYYEVTAIDYDADDDFTVTIKDLLDGDTITFEDELDSEEVGEITISLDAVTTDYAYFTFAGTALNYNYAVSETGLLVTLPTDVSTLTTAVGVDIVFDEQDKDGDVGAGSGSVTATVMATTDDTIHVSGHTLSGVDVEESEDVMIAHIASELASKITWDQTDDDNEFEIEYYGEEVIAKVMVVGGAATVSGGTNSLGNILVKDTEVSSVATKNLIVVGGSCINSAAAALVGGTLCGASWTEATGIGSGQFLIKGYEDSTLTTELALLVAGYDAEDTVKATTYLTNKVVDTSKAYKGTTTTETAVVID